MKYNINSPKKYLINKHQTGGLIKKSNLFRTNKTQYVDSVLNSPENKNKEWVKRLTQPNTPSMPTPNTLSGYKPGMRSTHLMSDNDQGYVFPTVVGINNNLRFIGDRAEDYARENNTGIQLPVEQGTWFARNGYKQGTNVLKSYKKGGKNWIQNAVNPAHKGYCTPMTKSTCTPKRKAFAMTMKKHHGFHKK